MGAFQTGLWDWTPFQPHPYPYQGTWLQCPADADWKSLTTAQMWARRSRLHVFKGSRGLMI